MRGWKTEVAEDRITFERGDWFCVARFDDVLTIARSCEWPDKMAMCCRILCAAKKMVAYWIREDGLPVKPRSATYWDMVDAIREAVDKE